MGKIVAQVTGQQSRLQVRDQAKWGLAAEYPVIDLILLALLIRDDHGSPAGLVEVDRAAVMLHSGRVMSDAPSPTARAASRRFWTLG